MTDRALIILTSHDKLGDTGKETGFYWEELATPYWKLVDHGLTVDIASVAGGEPPADPSSADGDDLTEAVRRFWNDDTAMKALKNSAAAETVDGTAYRLVFLPGGHGTMWDLPESEAVASLVSRAYDDGAVIGAVCHGPAGLLGATLVGGEPLLKGRQVSGFTDSEERAVGLEKVVPFLLETRLREHRCDLRRRRRLRGARAARRTARDGAEPALVRQGRRADDRGAVLGRARLVPSRGLTVAWPASGEPEEGTIERARRGRREPRAGWVAEWVAEWVAGRVACPPDRDGGETVAPAFVVL